MNVLRPSDVILSSFVNKEQLPLDFFCGSRVNLALGMYLGLLVQNTLIVTDLHRRRVNHPSKVMSGC